MAGTRRWRRAHVLKSVPSPRRDSEGSQITQIRTLLRASTKDIHHIIDECSSVAFARDGNVSYTIQLRPLNGGRVEAPNVVEPLEAVRTAKATSENQHLHQHLGNWLCPYRYILSL